MQHRQDRCCKINVWMNQLHNAHTFLTISKYLKYMYIYVYTCKTVESSLRHCQFFCTKCILHLLLAMLKNLADGSLNYFRMLKGARLCTLAIK